MSTPGSLANSTGSKTSGYGNSCTRLRTIASEVRGRLSVTKDATRRLTLEDQLLDIYREQQSRCRSRSATRSKPPTRR